MATDQRVIDALELLRNRFADIEQDGPTAYANFLSQTGEDEAARLRQQAVATVRAFSAAFDDASMS